MKTELDDAGRPLQTGNLLLRFREAPQEHSRAAASGGQDLAAYLAGRCPAVVVLDDRRLPDGDANIDHLAVAPSGIWVIGGSDRTKLVDGLQLEVDAVIAAAAPISPQTAVHACFCFPNPAARWSGGVPLLRTLSVRSHPLVHPRRLAKRLNQPGPLDPERIRTLAKRLAAAFPSATS